MTAVRVGVRRYVRSALEECRLRGLVAQVSAREEVLLENVRRRPQMVKLYCGVDPTARSVHLGNLVPLMVLLNFYVRGSPVVNIVGGATGKVGDPSGRTTERSAMSSSVREDNVSAISQQLKTFFKRGAEYYAKRQGLQGALKGVPAGHTVVNNLTWWQDVNMLDFLARYGGHIRVQAMLARDSVSSRLAQPQTGLGFNEFTYQILQAYDFYHLYTEQGVSVQVGGNDQWGNITAGIDLIERVRAETARGESKKATSLPATAITCPLLTTSSGQKFGKSAGNAVFIDKSINTPYDIYQFFYNTEDADVERFLKIFTLLPLEQIATVMATHRASAHGANRTDHAGVRGYGTDPVGLRTRRDAQMVSDIVFGKGQGAAAENRDLSLLFKKAGILTEVPRDRATPLELVTRVLQCSKTEAKRKLDQGAVYWGPGRLALPPTSAHDAIDWDEHLLNPQVLLVRVGKQRCFPVKLV
ncbi:tyrosine--tRNA ligase MSY1 KNAG_0A01770 [Huiozyma naganishii CBS 8797]|uniref:Tyrosine--tRNA ligase n=1 Tax=Huiozyma naganishii (strain ATCC MYA-139 / BCRC 22969 / CBS 8797 / KCTC 17520 / NBRC 10181 / NCYC 3082 / Yp74L-3) TaxID=1071383 RepID=J7S390_HUIN7|nr:hypothetical protein KNAG_0A01770 [Kazachstania naganishii CBS 8797]CCK67866.1 hypothetical protein KNAG_0A01770 [Kazachstania naganishii CBS 8797]